MGKQTFARHVQAGHTGVGGGRTGANDEQRGLVRHVVNGERLVCERVLLRSQQRAIEVQTHKRQGLTIKHQRTGQGRARLTHNSQFCPDRCLFCLKIKLKRDFRNQKRKGQVILPANGYSGVCAHELASKSC